MHNVRRVPKPAAQALAERKAKEAIEIAEYTKLSDAVLAKKKSGEYTQDALALTTQLLKRNPEYYTVWNYRRWIFIRGIFLTSTPEQIYNILSGDLDMTFAALKKHPKVYWIWNHRRWCLENIPRSESSDEDDGLGWQRKVWGMELFVVEKMLDADARNFHAWNYRRYILASLPPQPRSSATDAPPLPSRTPQTELAYTTSKIEANFSNFSAWHQRSKVYGSLGTLKEDSVALDAEFEFVKQALWTDPGDQSAWLYHRWLISQRPERSNLEREIANIEELLEVEPDSKWCLELLVHYNLLLAKQGSASMDMSTVLGYLERLKAIDPMRKMRYLDISKELVG